MNGYMNKKFSKKEIPKIAKAILKKLTARPNGFIRAGKSKKQTACILAFSGDLGAGKTTLTQAIARELGVREKIISPTFVIMKSYKLQTKSYKFLIHVDAYRLEKDAELLRLGWQEIISDPENLVLIEWPERVQKIIPETAICINLSHEGDDTRCIEIEK